MHFKPQGDRDIQDISLWLGRWWSIDKSKGDIKKAQKLINDATLIETTDRLNYDWGVVTDNKTDELVSDSEDEKK